MVQEIRQELEKDDEEALSPIMVAKPVAPTREEDELMMDLGQTADKENSSGATDSSSTDGYMRTRRQIPRSAWTGARFRSREGR